MSDFLSGQLLISLPSMQGDYFSHTVTLLIEHNEDGAFGLVVNRPLDATLAELLGDQELLEDAATFDNIPLMESGPIEQNRLFFLHSHDGELDNAFSVNDRIVLSTSLDMVQKIHTAAGHTDIMAGLGYAGWSGGQLEDEIRRDVWLVTPYVHEAVFNSACEDRPQIAANAIGVDLNLIAPTPGHG